MKQYGAHRRLILFDSQAYWRDLAGQALLSAGLVVDICSDYHDLLRVQHVDQQATLVIFGCMTVNAHEQQLIERLVDAGFDLMVLCSALSCQTIRTLFHLRVVDVLEKSYDPGAIVVVVQQVLTRSTISSGYRSMEYEGGV